MEYYIYLLQIFGGGNPKIHEVIKAYGNARLAYEHISSGDMSHIPSNRHEYVRRASLERSKVIMDYCAGNNIGIVTIDDRNYPEQLKNIYNPPVLLFTAGDINCLQGKLAVSIVGPRKPFGNAIRLAENLQSCEKRHCSCKRLCTGHRQDSAQQQHPSPQADRGCACLRNNY